MKTSFVLALLALVALLAWCSVSREATRGAIDHESLNPTRIYAYRDWQSTGVRVHQGDLLAVEAEGEWTYTPGEVHGPEGHPIYLAPRFYPLPSAPGGVLIGRIGEEGDPFHVGRYMYRRVRENGLLYLRIDDDILSDNEGYVEIQINVESPEKD